MATYQLNCFKGIYDKTYVSMYVNGTYPTARARACQWISRNNKGGEAHVEIFPGSKEREEDIFRFDRNSDASLRGRYGSEYYIDGRTKRISLVDYRTGRLGKTVETWEP